jgi:hypothetical protein
MLGWCECEGQLFRGWFEILVREFDTSFANSGATPLAMLLFV